MWSLVKRTTMAFNADLSIIATCFPTPFLIFLRHPEFHLNIHRLLKLILMCRLQSGHKPALELKRRDFLSPLYSRLAVILFR
jgi:hypothetical protein